MKYLSVTGTEVVLEKNHFCLLSKEEKGLEAGAYYFMEVLRCWIYLGRHNKTFLRNSFLLLIFHWEACYFPLIGNQEWFEKVLGGLRVFLKNGSICILFCLIWNGLRIFALKIWAHLTKRHEWYFLISINATMINNKHNYYSVIHNSGVQIEWQAVYLTG